MSDMGSLSVLGKLRAKEPSRPLMRIQSPLNRFPVVVSPVVLLAFESMAPVQHTLLLIRRIIVEGRCVYFGKGKRVLLQTTTTEL